MDPASPLREAIDAVVREDRLTEIPPSSPDRPLSRFDAEDRDLLVQGDLADLRSVRGGRSLVVQGDIRGDERDPVRVEMHGDIIVTGSVTGAVLQGRRVLVGGNGTGAQITAALHVVVGTDLEGARVVVGDYQRDRRQIESTRTSMEQGHGSLESLRRRVLTEEKRLDRACRALRIPLDFNVGRIVEHAEGHVRVDLSSFYGSLEGRTEEQFEIALKEFFAKGIVGVITRQNRRYLVNFPAREKVFMQLVRSLRELFRTVLERDRLQRRLGWLGDRLEHMVDGLGQRATSVEVGGAIAGLTTLEFILPRVVCKDDTCEFVHQTASLELSGAAGVVSVASCGADGERSTSTILPSELGGQRFVVEEGRVVWEPAAETVGA